MSLRKKGTEKPIEIFVALFIILAVGLVMLKLFQNQLQQKQGELADVEQEQRLNELREQASLYCRQKCGDAASNRCSRAGLASLCMSYASSRVPHPNWLDLNVNGVKDIDFNLLAGVGMCEEAVPCFALIDTCCGQQINPSSCLDFLVDYWVEDLGRDSEFVNRTINRTMKLGLSATCEPDDDDVMWWNLSGTTGLSGLTNCTYWELANNAGGC